MVSIVEPSYHYGNCRNKSCQTIYIIKYLYSYWPKKNYVSKLSKEEQREIKRQEQEIFKAKALAVIEASKNDPFNGVQLKVPVSESPKSTFKVRKAAKQEQEAEKAPQENHNSSKVERVVMIPLREDYQIRIALPSDVTKSEVDFLANMLRRSMI